MIKIPKLANGGIIKSPVNSITPEEYMYGIFMTQQEMIEKMQHQKKVIDRLSRKIQRLKKDFKKLKNEKINTLYGNKVIIVPDSMAKDIMIVDKKIFEVGDIK